jgi:CBS domain-containing protein
MSPSSFTNPLVRDAPTMRAEQPVADALQAMADADLPAVPVVDGDGRLLGIFGEREFIGALFPGYLKEMTFAGFVPRELETALEKRAGCAREAVGSHLNTEHIDVDADHYSDTQIAEIFLHHRALLIPVADRDRRVVGVITRRDFTAALAERILKAR